MYSTAMWGDETKLTKARVINDMIWFDMIWYFDMKLNSAKKNHLNTKIENSCTKMRWFCLKKKPYAKNCFFNLKKTKIQTIISF